MSDAVTLVVVTRNRPSDIRRSLPSWLANLDDLAEIVVVDQSDDNCTERLVAEHGRDRRLRYLRSPEVGLSVGRNVGLAQAASPIVAFTDDDCVLPPGWARSIAILLAEPSISAFFGAVVAEPFDWRLGHTPSVPTPPDRTLAIADPRQIPGVMGANMAFRRTALIGIGGFDTVLGAGAPLQSAEEVDALYRLVRAGHRVAVRPEPRVMHFGFRSYASGASRSAVCGTHLGMAAFYTKHMRTGDRRAVLAYVRHVRLAGQEIFSNLLRRRRPVGASRAVYILVGLLQGFRYAIDHEQVVFKHAR